MHMAPGAAPAATPAAPSKAAAEAGSSAEADATPAPGSGEDAAMPDLVDDPELALALQMSLAEAQQAPEEEDKKE